MVNGAVMSTFQLTSRRDNFGQFFIGKLFMQNGSVHGDILFRSTAVTLHHAYPRPVLIRPNQPENFLGRQPEREKAIKAAQEGDALLFCGPSRVGKTWLLRQLSHELPPHPDGLVFILATGKRLDELLQTIFEQFYFYKNHHIVAPMAVERQQALQPIQALILLDDIQLNVGQVDYLLDLLPNCSFLFTSKKTLLSNNIQTHFLNPIPLDNAIDNNTHSGAGVEEETGLSAQEQDMLAIIGAVENAPLTCAHLQKLSGGNDTFSVLEGLTSKGLIEVFDSSLYQLSEEQQVVQYLEKFDREPVSVQQLIDEIHTTHIDHTLKALKAKKWIELIKGEGTDYFIQLTPERQILLELANLGGGPVSYGRLSARVNDVEIREILTDHVINGWVESIPGENHRLLYQLAPAQIVLNKFGELGGGPLKLSQLNYLVSRADIGTILGELELEGSVEIVKRYQSTSRAGEYLKEINIDGYRQQIFHYFITIFNSDRKKPHSLTTVSLAVQHLINWLMAEARWSDAFQLIRHYEQVLAYQLDWSAWEQMLQQGLIASKNLGDLAKEAWIRHQIGTRARCLGDHKTAFTNLSKALKIRRELGDHEAAAVTWNNFKPMLLPSNRMAGTSVNKKNSNAWWYLLIPLLLITCFAGFSLFLVAFQFTETLSSNPDKSLNLPVATQNQILIRNNDDLSDFLIATTPTFPIKEQTTIPVTMDTAVPTTTLTPSPLPTVTPTPCVVQKPANWVRSNIVRGDTLYDLARKHSTSIEKIEQANCLYEKGLLAGQQIWLPYIPPTPTPRPFLAVDQVQQAGPVSYQNGRIIVPLGIHIRNSGGSEGVLSQISVLYSNGNDVLIQAPNGFSGASLAPGQDIVAQTELLLNLSSIPTLPTTINVLARGDSQSAPVAIHLVLPAPIVKIDSPAGVPLTAFDGQAELWHTTINLRGVLENAHLFQNVAWQWSGFIGDQNLSESGQSLKRNLQHKTACTLYNITLTVNGNIGHYPASGSANVQSQCAEP